MPINCDARTVTGFGKEWTRFVAARVGRLHCTDPGAEAPGVERRNLAEEPNCGFHLASAADMPLADNSADSGCSLGVPHHLPDTEAGIRCCVAKLKGGAPLLLDLHYAFDNQPAWRRIVWRVTDLLRRLIACSPFAAKYADSQAFAFCMYWPLARAARQARRWGESVHSFPLAGHRHRSVHYAADRRAGPIRHEAGTSLHALPDPEHDGTGGPRENRFRRGSAPLVCSGVQKEPCWRRVGALRHVRNSRHL
jgi:SAM-dependent methyltransferase